MVKVALVECEDIHELSNCDAFLHLLNRCGVRHVLLNVYYDSPNAKTQGQNNSGDFTSHAYGCVYKASAKTWYIQEPYGEPLSLDSAGMK